MEGSVITESEYGPAHYPYFGRFEFGRRDYLLSPSTPTPLLATREWPEPWPPRERRVRFHIWQQ